MKRGKRQTGWVRKGFRLLFFVFVGISAGVICYELFMALRVARLQSQNPVTTSLIDTRVKETQERGETPTRYQVWVPLNRISPQLQRAVLAGEDSNFLAHRGFDYEAIQKAWDHAIREAAKEAKKTGDSEADWFLSLPDFKRGASTISQQLAKNLYLSSDRTFIRKGQEAVLTVFLERLLTKPRILEIYLNVIEWGNGIYGAEAAAQYHLKKSAASLTPAEAAFLAAMIPNPRTVYNPQSNSKRVARRQKIIMRGMPHVKIP
jgi:monofunctional biosynthetic peptidoglycan transglycosylase